MPRTPRTEPDYKLSWRKDKEKYYVTWTEQEWNERTQEWQSRSKRISTGTSDKRHAQRFFYEFLGRLDEKKQEQDIRLQELLNKYLNAKQDSIADFNRQQRCAKKVYRFFGDVSIEAITPRRVKQYTEAQSEAGCSNDTIGRELSVLRAALYWARKNMYIRDIPFIELPKKGAPKDRWLTDDELEKLRQACVSFHIRLFVEIAYNTGARTTAILELQWSQVDMKERRIDFNAPGRVQTIKGRSDVPINDYLYDFLFDAKRLATTDYVIEWDSKPVKSIRKAFERTCKRAGLENVTPHTLRHTAATHMARDRIPMREIAGVLGHSSTHITEKVYAKHHPDFLRDAVGALSKKQVGEGQDSATPTVKAPFLDRNDSKIRQPIDVINIETATLDNIAISEKAYNALKKAGLFMLKDICQKTYVDFLTLPKFGRTSLRSLEAELQKYNLKLKGR